VPGRPYLRPPTRVAHPGGRRRRYIVRMGKQGLAPRASPSRTRRRTDLACVALTFALAAPVHALDAPKSISQFTHTAWSAKDGIPGAVRARAPTHDGYLSLGSESSLC